jgi:type IV pilus assembly protein PilB
MIGKKLDLIAVDAESLRKAIERHYGIPVSSSRRRGTGEAQFVSVRDQDASGETVVAEGSAIGPVNRIISEAIEIGASDIHIEPYERSFRIRYRIDGVLCEVESPPHAASKSITSRLKIMANLDIAEKRRPQDGRIRVRQGDHTIDIRVSTLPTDFGEKVVLRILDKSQLCLDLSSLGFEHRDLDVFKRTIYLPYGMILVTGPTGSGKTTTLYAALNEINRPEVNITTIEDPIEYNLQGINQTHIRADIGLTFAAALRSILRQDPNIIMVGEIRDSETANIAVRSALTGHLVFSTLHTNDAPSAITRLVDMGVEPFLVASSVKMILAQRLLRKLCDKCKAPTEPTREQREELQLNGKANRFFSKRGCSECSNLGYKGRTAIYEALPINNGVSDLIAAGVTASELRSHARQSEFKTLRQAAMRKAERGETSLEEVIRETAS